MSCSTFVTGSVSYVRAARFVFFQMNVLHGTGVITEDLYTEYKGAFTDWGTIGYEIMEEIKAGKEDQAVDGILNKCTPALNSLVEISKKLDALTDKQRSKAVQSTIFCAVAGIAVIIIFLLLAWAIAKKCHSGINPILFKISCRHKTVSCIITVTT